MDFEKSQDCLLISASKYGVGQAPDLVPIQTIDFSKEKIKDKDALPLKLELCPLYPFSEIGGTYVTPKGLFRFRRKAKEVIEWV
jgi:hypothetical protein